MRSLLLFFFSHRTLANLRWDLHLLRVRLKNRLTGSHQKLTVFVSRRSSPVYLNLGSGPRGLDSPHWINIDAFPDTNVHFLLDFNRPLPFADATLDGVFCEHVLEHFTIEDGRQMMTEVHRALKPGGVVRIIVPDAEWVMRSYFDQPEALLKHRLGSEATSSSPSPMEVVNQYFRQRYEHHFLYDAATLTKMLRSIGFAEANRVRYRETHHSKDLLLDDSKYEPESLYVEAVKGETRGLSPET
jgi:predicted SAM-dependent methyltransferase